MNKAPFGTLASLYHRPRQPMQQPMQGGMQQRPQDPMQGVMRQFMGQMIGLPQQQRRPGGGFNYNAGGSGAMNAIIAQLMQRGR
jgi:hypothetical protein